MSFKAELRSLETKSFDGATLADTDSLAEFMEKEGKFTLDDAGKLTVINPPERRDGGFVRFFKGLFNPTYKAEQRMLDRMEVLGRNVTFTENLRAACGRFTPSGVSAAFAWNRVFNAVLTKAQPSGSAPLEMALLRKAATEATTFLQVMDHQQDFFTAQDGRTVPVVTASGPISLGTFIEANRTETTQLAPFDAVITAVCTGVLQGKDMGSILTERDAARFSLLMANDALTPQETNELAGLRDKAARNVVNALSTFANTALENGADPSKLANHLGSTLSGFGRGNSGPGGVIANKLSAPEQFAAANSAAERQTPELPETPHRDVALAGVGGDKAKAARLMHKCERYGYSPMQLGAAMNMAKNIAVVLDMGSGDETSLTDKANALRELAGQMERLVEENPNLGADDYIPFFDLGAFAAWLNEGEPPMDFTYLELLGAACLDLDAERPELNAHTPTTPLGALFRVVTSSMISVQGAAGGSVPEAARAVPPGYPLALFEAPAQQA